MPRQTQEKAESCLIAMLVLFSTCQHHLWCGGFQLQVPEAFSKVSFCLFARNTLEIPQPSAGLLSEYQAESSIWMTHSSGGQRGWNVIPCRLPSQPSRSKTRRREGWPSGCDHDLRAALLRLPILPTQALNLFHISPVCPRGLAYT